MGAQSLVHDVDGDVVAVCQVPQQVEHFVSHHSVLIVLRQPADQLQKLLPLLLTSVRPTGLHQNTQTDPSMLSQHRPALHDECEAHLEAGEQMIELLRGKIPRQLGQQIVDVLDDGFVFTSLREHDTVDNLPYLLFNRLQTESNQK